MALRVNEENFEKEVLNSEIPVLADFYSDSCVPCKRLSPVLAEIEEELSSDIKFVKININFDGTIAEKYEVYSVPTLVFFKSGSELSRLSGAVDKKAILELLK
ncbi:MAG: thioredoxin [Clostridia bacterium]|nr:thioredoxin [Clostridia bacterium]